MASLQPSLLRFLFLSLCWIAFLFSLFNVSNSDPDSSSTKKVDGGLAGKYAKNVELADQQVTFFWTLSKDTISIAAQAAKKSGYLAIGFGSTMIGSFAYVGYLDGSGKGKVSTYHIEGKSPDDIQPTKEKLTKMSAKSENGIITFEFTRDLDPKCNPEERDECGNIIDPQTPLKVIWSMGPEWSDTKLSKANMHVAFSSKPTSVMLLDGTAKAEKSIPLLLILHGSLMFLAWGLILPVGVVAARYLKHHDGDKWLRLHMYFQYSGLAVVITAFICILLLLKGLRFDAWHVKLGIVAIALGFLQPVNAFFRPSKPLSWEESSSQRVIWEYIHRICGRFAVIVAIAALITGLKLLGEPYGVILTYVLIAWIVVGVITLICLEIRLRKRLRKERDMRIGQQQFIKERSMKIPM